MMRAQDGPFDMNARVTRRRTLTAGASLVVGTSLSGCVGTDDETTGTEADGESDDDGEPGVDPPSDALGIDHLRLVTDKPTGHREYEPAADETYPTDATVWFYFEPVGITTEATDDGQERVDLSCRLTVSSEGTERFSDRVPYERDVPEGRRDDLYLYLYYQPERPAKPGRYTAEIELTDEQSGASTTERITFRLEGDEPDLAIEHVEFVEDQPTDYREYTQVDDAVYGADDSIWLYVEPTGVALERRDGEEWFDIRLSVTPTDPDGEERRGITESIAQPVLADRDIDKLYLYASIDVRDPVAGEYTFEIEVSDTIGRNEARTTVTARIEDRDLELVEILREVIEEETDVDIEQLRLRGETVSLVYHSPHEFDAEDFDGDVGYVAGAYSVLAGEGIDAEQLRVSGTDADDQEFAFRIVTETAAAFDRDEITEDDYLEHVFESLRKRE